MAGKASRLDRARGRNEERRVLLMEISRRNDPEALMTLAEEAMRGLLAMSSAICKYWRFYMPPAVKVEFVFDNKQYANEFAEKAGRIMKARRATRTLDGKTYPSMRVDWAQWHAMKNNPRRADRAALHNSRKLHPAKEPAESAQTPNQRHSALLGNNRGIPRKPGRRWNQSKR